MSGRRAGVDLTLVDGRVLGGGPDEARQVARRIQSLRLSERRENDADEMDLVLENTDGGLAMPAPGDRLSLRLGWERGADVALGLIDKGVFTVDEVELRGPPDTLSIRARSADLTGTLRQRRTHSWRDTTLGTILGQIAARYGKGARIGGGLADQAIEAIEQEGKSDMAFLRDLGRRYDAIATWKNDLLLFLPIGRSASAGGEALPVIDLTPRDGFAWSAREASRERYDGAEAQWQDQDGGRRRTVRVGGSENPRRLKRVYASKAEARQAAEAAFARAQRRPWRFTLDLALADPARQPDAPVRLTGWDPRIDALDWLIESVDTSFDGAGLRQKIELESV